MTSEILKRQTLVAMATKFAKKLVITCMGNITEMFAPSKGFGVGLLNDVRQILPRPTPVAMATKIWNKIGNNSGFCGRLSPRFLHTAEVFWAWAIECCHTNSTTTNPCCHGNEIWDKIDYNSICIGNIIEILAQYGVVRVWLLNGNEIWHKIGSTYI